MKDAQASHIHFDDDDDDSPHAESLSNQLSNKVVKCAQTFIMRYGFVYLHDIVLYECLIACCVLC